MLDCNRSFAVALCSAFLQFIRKRTLDRSGWNLFVVLRSRLMYSTIQREWPPALKKQTHTLLGWPFRMMFDS